MMVETIDAGTPGDPFPYIDKYHGVSVVTRESITIDNYVSVYDHNVIELQELGPLCSESVNSLVNKFF